MLNGLLLLPLQRIYHSPAWTVNGTCEEKRRRQTSLCVPAKAMAIDSKVYMYATSIHPSLSKIGKTSYHA